MASSDEVGVTARESLDGVSVAFGGNVVLDDLSLGLSPGYTGLIGPNGAGKTTCLNVLSGYVKPDHGELRLHGRRAAGLGPHQLVSRGVSRTFQTPRLVPNLTVLDNVRLGAYRNYRRGHVSELLGLRAARKSQQEQLTFSRDLLSAFGMAAVAEQAGGTLSVGRQKIIEVARALASRPQILLLDEPAAGLSAWDVDALVSGLWSHAVMTDVAVLLIEHDLSLIRRLCDDVAVLHFGHILRRGSADSVMKDQQVVEAYMGAGFAADG
jgi:branched-chain amino acid transport system ATP-binding protein